MRYTDDVSKHTSLYIDEALLQAAEQALGTSGPTGTVRAALEEVVRRAQLRSLAAWDLELAPAELDALRRPALTPSE